MRIQDIAKEAGVSTATISRVFSNHPNIRPEIRERVLKIARKHGFHPRLSNKRRNVVIVTPSKLEYPVQSYTEMLSSELSRELSARDYRTEILPQDNLERLDGIQFCAVIFAGMTDKIADDWDSRFDAPLIVLDRILEKSPKGVFSLHSDEAQGMELAISHFVEKGHRKVGALIGTIGLGNASVREKCILESLAKHKLPCDKSLVRFAGPENNLEEAGKLLRKGVDAIFCPGGNAGIITAYSLSLYGKRIPEDISIISSERSMVTRYCVPAQTSISQDYGALVSSTADIIDARLAGREFPKTTVLPYKLIVRDSVAERG